MKPTRAIAIPLILTLAAACSAHAASSRSAGKWDDDTLDTFAKLPILDGGRIKPLDTYAQFVMLRINGKRSYLPEGADRGDKLTSMEWFLDSLFYPEVARDYKNFIVDNADVISNIGLQRHEDQRGRYSYNELMPAREELFRRAQDVAMMEQGDRTAAQNMMLSLAQAINEFDSVIHFFDFTRHGFEVGSSRLAARLFEGRPDLRLADVLGRGQDLRNAIMALNSLSQEEGQEKYQQEIEAFTHFFYPLDLAGSTAISLRLIPPADLGDAEWHTPSDLVGVVFEEDDQGRVAPIDAGELALLASLETMARNPENRLAFKHELNIFAASVKERAELRGEYSKIPLEVGFYRAKLFFHSQWMFVLSFVFAAVSWLNLRSKWLGRATALSVVVPWCFLVTGIVLRSIIRGRPPVSTLYETVLFIAAVAVFAALFIEWLNRQRIALSVAAVLGTLGIFIANRYEITNKEDTMPSLVAVLDTNFWLATHVTIINVGYAAGMLAAAIAHFYIFGKLFGYKSDDPKFYRSITRMVYGVTCFGLLFAFIGTVLGGIWANYSWGRFWGWDPKENGAALICLCQLAMLHARMGGLIRQMGLHIAAVFTGGVVAFSWWGVNLLGVGLHSYGFTSGIWKITFAFWATQAFVMLLGFIVLLRARLAKTDPPAGQEAAS